MENISFEYKEENLLTNFSLKMSQGDFIGLSGISGKGKTTVINLLLGFLEPSYGNILINDKITTGSDRKKYWGNISYVKQQSFLIHDTILTNITLNETDPDKQRLEDAVKVTGLDIMAKESPERSNKLITENGKNISGGQRQRIAMARALYKNANLIILDEPFNELDRKSEDRLVQHFAQLAGQGKMILLITHNKESLSFCHKIVSLDEF